MSTQTPNSYAEQENPHASNELSEFYVQDGIVFGRYKEGVLLDLEGAQDCVRVRNALQAGKTMPLLLDISGLKELTKSAREYLSSPESLRTTSAGVLLTNNSVFVRALANLYFKLSTPNIPHRMFSDKQKAIAWLKTYREISA